MSRLHTTIARILATNRTMGMGRVTATVRPGEIRLENRSERVVVAGSVTPAIGTEIPWVTVNPGLLVAAYTLPRGMPAPALAEPPPLFPIALQAELLYGAELDVGWYWYVASFLPEEGATGVLPGSAWVETKALADPPSGPTHSFVPGGNWPLGWWMVRQSIFKADGTGGDGETAMSSYTAWEATPGWRTMRLGYGEGYLKNFLRNGTGYRAYAQPGHWVPGFPYSDWVADGPYRMIAEKIGKQWTDLDIANPAFGPEPPAEATLAARRVGMMVTISEEATSYYSRVRLYRTIAGDKGTPLDLSMYGQVQDLDLPVPLSALPPLNWIDDTGPGIGEPPPFGWEQGEEL